MREKKKANYTFYFIVVLVLGVFGYFIWKGNSEPGKYDTFAQCLSDSGAKMYGAWWCPHCVSQKQSFGKSWKLFADSGYIECSTPEKTQLPVCTQAGIEGYPTWRFADGSELSGEVSFYTLSTKTNCTLLTGN